jgi:asparagine synthase (glutamine-hydrolysing)
LITATLPDGSLIFASELKQLLAHPSLRRDIDPLAVEDFMAWGYVPDHRSIIRGVEKLPAGHYRLLRHDARLGTGAMVGCRLFRAVAGRGSRSRRRTVAPLAGCGHVPMTADVPLGAFLSGGVDSSSVVALMAEASREPVKTCSIGFDVSALDETGYASRIAEQFHTEHYARTVGADDFAMIDRLAAMFDEPFADASALPTWRVCQLAREHVTVALSGDGADEAFAGYRRQAFQHRESQLRDWLPQAVRGPLFGALGRPIRRSPGPRVPCGRGRHCSACHAAARRAMRVPWR